MKLKYGKEKIYHILDYYVNLKKMLTIFHVEKLLSDEFNLKKCYNL